MMIKYPIFVDSYALFQEIPEEGETEFLTEIFMIFASHHVIEAYKKLQKRRPDLYPPLQEEQ